MPRPDSSPLIDFDLLVLAPTVHTLDPEPAPRVEPTAVGIRDGVITWLGSAAEVDPDRAAEVLHISEGCVTPGLVDAHIHPIGGVGLVRGLDLSRVRTLEELHASLAEATESPASTDPEGTWLLGWGLDPNVVADRALCAADLDAVVDDRPVLIRLFDVHSALANTRALELAGVTGREVFDSAAVVEVDGVGRPTGLLKESDAISVVQSHVPEPPFAERLDGMLSVLGRMADAGLTGGQVLDWSADMLELVRAAEAIGELPIRLQISPWIMPRDQEDQVQRVIDLQGVSGRRWRVDGVKLMIDGTIDNGTAWLQTPDTLGESTRPLWLDPESYTEILCRLDAEEIRTTTHAIGDAGVRHVLDAIAALPRRPGTDTDLPRHRIEHLETLPDELVARFAELDVAASMQPTHCTLFCAGDGTDHWSQRLGEERAGRAWRLGSLRQAGVTVAIGSDWPVAPCEPLRIIADGQLRREAGERSQTPIVPDEALTARQMLEGYTTHRARSWGDRDGGRIAVGAPADLSVFAADPLTVDADDLPGTAVIATVVGGRVRYPGGPGDQAPTS